MWKSLNDTNYFNRNKHVLTAAGPQIVTTVVPVGPHPTHMICPSCHAEIDTATKTKPGLIACISGAIIFLLG